MPTECVVLVVADTQTVGIVADEADCAKTSRLVTRQ
jgi:hypothetical protein